MGDSSKGEVGSLPQELLRFFTPDLDQVILKRHVDHAMEQPTEVILAQAGLGRDVFEVQPLGITLMHEFDGPLDSRMGQRGLVDGKGVARLSGSALYHDLTVPRAPKAMELRRRELAPEERPRIREQGYGLGGSGLVVGRASYAGVSQAMGQKSHQPRHD